MPLENFSLSGKSEDTLKIWSRKLNYLFQNLDIDNILSTSLTFGSAQIKQSNIDFGLGIGQVGADDIPLTDASSYFVGTSVETVLQEIGNNLSTHTGSTNIHYLTTNISHTVLQDIGTNSHSNIDSHISSTSLHLSPASTVTSALSTTLSGTTDLSVAVALISDLNKTNSLINEIRQALINQGILV